MATTVIRNSCFAGALAGISAARFNGSVTPTDYASLVNAADAIADEFITVNAGSGAAIADGDNAQVGPLVQSVAFATLMGIGTTDTTAADYLKLANQIYAESKQGITKLT